MSHLRLVPPLPEEPAETTPPLPSTDDNVRLMFFQAASGICLCRECTKRRHPAFGGGL